MNPMHFVKPIRSVCILLSCLLGVVLSAQTMEVRYNTDSIIRELMALPDDTNKVNAINNAYNNILWVYDIPEAYNALKYAAKLASTLQFKRGEYRSYTNMSGYCNRVGVGDFALSNRIKASEIAGELGDSTRILNSMMGMGLAYSSMNQPRMSLNCYHAIRGPMEKRADADALGRLYTFMGWCYHALNDPDSALYFANMAASWRRSIHYGDGILSSGGVLRDAYMSKKMYDSARAIINECILINDTMGRISDANFARFEIGVVCEAEGKLDSALYYYLRLEHFADSARNGNFRRRAYKQLYQLYEKMGRYELASRYSIKYIAIHDSLNAEASKVSMLRLKEIYDVESKNQEIELLNRETELKQNEIDAQDRQRLWLFGIIGITVVLIIVALFAYRQKRKSALVLAEQKSIIEERNKDITDSIVYARRIQYAMMPQDSQLTTLLPGSFIFYRPKDIVSGDFFWFHETSEYIFVAVADCTGHGVPGALMSMIGLNYFTQIVGEMRINSPAEILNEMHKKVLLALNKDLSVHDIKDGMDTSLLRIRKGTGECTFAGAVRPLYIVRDGQLEEIKGDIYSIGGIKSVDQESFTEHTVQLSHGNCVYLFSDGIADQFGGPKGKKFKYKQLRETILKVAHLDGKDQAAHLDQVFTQWKGNLEQVDDVCIIGLKF
jgi:serine phosphatase RsbU (regulator of sigma subunit)